MANHEKISRPPLTPLSASTRDGYTIAFTTKQPHYSALIQPSSHGGRTLQLIKSNSIDEEREGTAREVSWSNENRDASYLGSAQEEVRGLGG